MPDNDPFPLQIKHQTLSQQVFTFVNDPRHTFGLLFGSVAIISLTIFGILVVSQNLSVATTLENQESAIQKNSLVQKQTQDKEKSEKLAILDAQRKSDLNTIKQALVKFKGRNFFYPQSLSVLVPDYLAIAPRDPETRVEYFYQPQVDQKNFELKAALNSGEEFILTEN